MDEVAEARILPEMARGSGNNMIRSKTLQAACLHCAVSGLEVAGEALTVEERA